MTGLLHALDCESEVIHVLVLAWPTVMPRASPRLAQMRRRPVQ